MILVLGLLASCAEQQRPSPDEIGERVTEYVRPLVENREFSGVIRIERGGELLFEDAWGYADFDREERHNTDGRFSIASVSKTLTAAAVVKLESEGEISFDEPVGSYLPDFEHGDEITVLHLLRFESGLAEIETDRPLTGAELLEEIGSRPLEFDPGTEERYGNSGYNVLAILVEEITLNPFGAYLNEAFFEPLGMDETGLRSDLDSEEEILVSPHKPGPPPDLVFKAPYSNPFSAIGSGALYSTAEDLARWGLAAARNEIIDFDRLQYPWGWGTTQIEGHQGLSQTGMHSGFTSSLQVFPEEEIVIVMLNNIEAGMWGDWAKDLSRIVFGAEPLMEHEPYDYLDTLPDGARVDYPGRYELNRNRFVEIREADGSLWLHLNGVEIGHHLLPLEEGGYQLRDFTGRIYFNRSEEGEVASLTWELPQVWDALDETYRRTN